MGRRGRFGRQPVLYGKGERKRRYGPNYPRHLCAIDGNANDGVVRRHLHREELSTGILHKVHHEGKQVFVLINGERPVPSAINGERLVPHYIGIGEDVHFCQLVQAVKNLHVFSPLGFVCVLIQT